MKEIKANDGEYGSILLLRSIIVERAYLGSSAEEVGEENTGQCR